MRPEFHVMRPDEDEMPELNPEGVRNVLILVGLLLAAAAVVVWH